MSPKSLAGARKSPHPTIDTAFGGPEELAIAMIDACPEWLEGEMTLAEVAKALNMPEVELGRAIARPEFNRTLDQMAAYAEYSFAKRRIAMKNLAHIANTLQKVTLTRSGRPVHVDRDADEIIKADTHLRKLQGQPVDEPKTNIGVGIQIVFGGGGPEGGEYGPDRTVDVTVDSQNLETPDPPDGFRPKRAGTLPPPGTRHLYPGETRVESEERSSPLRRELDFSNEEDPGPRGTGSIAAAKALAEGTWDPDGGDEP